MPISWYQEIRTVGGFGYGVQHADLHVFANGMPLYLLANWHEPVEADPLWLRELPSRMLNARRETVPFTGRVDELEQLRGWRDGGPERAVRWMHGPGGQGKSRLAACFARETASAGWRVAHAFHGPDAELLEPGSQDMSLTGKPGLLLLVDYADRWRFQHLTWLFKNRLLHTGRTRVLFLARGADSWPAVEGMLDPYEARTESVALGSLPVGSRPERLPGEDAKGEAPLTGVPQAPGVPLRQDPRAEMFAAARATFAALYERPDVAAVPPPGPLDTEEFGLTLSLHLAALVAVDAAVRGERPPADAAGLTRYLLNREQLHWERLHADGETAADHGYRTTRAEMNRAVFAAVLSGHRPPDEGERLLGAAGLTQPATALRDHTFCYPPPVPGTTLEPLYPDRLAEDFLALTLPGHTTGYPAQAWAPTTATHLITEHPSSVDRGLVFLATAAERWPHVRHGVLYPLLRAEPRRAVSAGNAVLELLARMDDIDTGLLGTVENEFPLTQHPDLDSGMASLTTVLTARSLAEASGAAEKIHLLQRLATRLLAAGRVAQAQDVTETLERASEEYERTLSDHRPDASGIKALLERYGERLGSNKWDGSVSYLIYENGPGGREILDAIQGSEGYARARVARAEALIGSAHVQHSRGQYREGAEIASRAVALLREAGVPDDGSALPLALETLALNLGDSGRHEDALVAAEEAVELVRTQPDDGDKHRYLLANLVKGQALWLGHLHRYAEAVVANDEAQALCEAIIDRERYPVDNTLAYIHNNISSDLADLGRHDESLLHIRSAAAIRKKYAQLNPALHGREYAMSLYNLGARLENAGEYEEALSVTRRSVELLEQLVKEDSKALPTLADALANLHARTVRGQSAPLGTPHLDNATKIYTKLAKENPAAYRPRLADAIEEAGHVQLRNNNLIAARRFVGRVLPMRIELLSDSRTAQWHALARSLVLAIQSCADHAPRWPNPQFAQLYGHAQDALLSSAVPPDGHEVLSALTKILMGSRRLSEGLYVAAATVDAMSAAEVDDPDTLSEALFNFAMLEYWTVQPVDDTLATVRSALEHLPPEAVSGDPALCHRRAMLLHLAGQAVARAGRHKDGLGFSEEALDTYRALAGIHASVYAHHFGFLLEEAADLAERCGAPDRARAHAEECRAVYSSAAARDPDHFLPAMRRVENFLSGRGISPPLPPPSYEDSAGPERGPAPEPPSATR
ncbi:hypothetical protein K377_07866 [Streptomyces sp. PsTaAH-137]|nr:hypothetical protein K377_07866 [Streptomyces sp. PsTaAH-137]